MDENTEIVIDYDQIAFQGASALEKTFIDAVHTASGRKKRFKNKTEFWGSTKAIGGWLAASNAERVKEGKSPFSKEDFEIENVQVPAENIAHTFQAAKSKLEGIVKHVGLTKYSGVIGIGKTFRHHLELPKEYKSSRAETKPIQLSETKDYLVERHNGDVVIDIEADDALEIKAFAGYNSYKATGKASHIIASIDKDSLHTPGFLLNFYREKGETTYKQPEIIYIDESIGDIWIVEKTNSKGKITKDVKGWGSFWLAYQLLMGDDTDTIRPYQDFGIKFGDMKAYELMRPCTTQAELFQVVKNQYHEWFPDGVKFTSWTGNEISITADEWLETIFSLVYMKRVENDTTTFASMLEGYQENK